MPRRKKSSSQVLETGAKRAAGLEAIDPQLDLGNGLTLALYKTALTEAQTAMNTHNTAVAALDDADNTFKASEARLRDLNERMLAGVASKFGRDSSQYEQAGGTKKSERRRRKSGNGDTSTKAAG